MFIWVVIIVTEPHLSFPQNSVSFSSFHSSSSMCWASWVRSLSQCPGLPVVACFWAKILDLRRRERGLPAALAWTQGRQDVTNKFVIHYSWTPLWAATSVSHSATLPPFRWAIKELPLSWDKSRVPVMASASPRRRRVWMATLGTPSGCKKPEPTTTLTVHAVWVPIKWRLRQRKGRNDKKFTRSGRKAAKRKQLRKRRFGESSRIIRRHLIWIGGNDSVCRGRGHEDRKRWRPWRK